MGHPVVHFEVHSQHSEALRSFYSELFGWKLGVVPDGSFAMVDTDAGGEGIRGGIAQSADGLSGVMLYVRVPDIKAHLRRGGRLGARRAHRVPAGHDRRLP